MQSFFIVHDFNKSTGPFWAIEDVIRRGNCFINPTLAVFQWNHYHPRDVAGFLPMMFGIDVSFIAWTQYNAIRNEIENQYGSLDAETALILLQDVYLGKTNMAFRMLLAENTQTGRQWTASPKTGDIYIRFSDHGEDAYLNPMHSFNLYDLLARNPP